MKLFRFVSPAMMRSLSYELRNILCRYEISFSWSSVLNVASPLLLFELSAAIFTQRKKIQPKQQQRFLGTSHAYSSAVHGTGTF